MTTTMPEVPADWPVQPIPPGCGAMDRATCGTCGRSWDDAVVTSMTPAPSGRCPFEAFHPEPVEPESPEDGETTWRCVPSGGHDFHGQSLIIGEDGETVAVVYDGKAHGAMLAAAPRLARAARALLDEFGGDVPDWLRESAYELGAAIAEAEGRP